MIDLQPHHMAIVKDILQKWVPDAEVWVFGSRVKGNARPSSDLDMVVITSEALDIRTTHRLGEAFEDSMLPIRVDVLDWHTVSEKFREVIHARYEVLQKGADGTIVNGWPTPTLRIADLIDAKILVINDGYRAKNSELSTIGLPFARAQNLNNGFHFEGADCFPVKDIDKVGIKVSKIDDVVFTSKGTVGRFAIVNPSISQFVYAPQLCFWRVLRRNLINPRWLYYWMHSQEFIEQLSQVSGQTDMAEYVSLRDQHNMQITLPPLPEQRAIAHILGTLDDKIELNRRMNETLEAMARAIFKSWFVDFDPVRWNMQRKGSSAPADGPLSPELLALFPDSFEDSELGEIPKGWTVGTVGEHYKLTMGQSPPGSTYNEVEEGLPFYQGRTDFGLRYPSRRIYCTAPTRYAEPGDTLVSVRAPVGDINIASERCAIGRGVAAVRHRSGSQSLTFYTMHHLKDDFKQFEADGTVFGCINKVGFEHLPFTAPGKEVVMAFDRFVSPIDERIAQNVQLMSSLTGIRDTLLPKLISGELRVVDAERMVDGCV